jgi:hypothetical protein
MRQGHKPDRFLSTPIAVCCLAILCALALPAVAETVNFPDPKLEQVIRDAIGKPTGDIDSSDLVSLTDLDAHDKGIGNLEGLQHCIDLVTLDLSGNSISDLTPLASLLDLEDLELNDNDFSSVVPLAGLVNLTELALTFCSGVSDISPLAALVNLVNLEAHECSIEDISAVAGMISLTEAYLPGNRITDITPLAGLANLSTLSLGENQIADITPLAGLISLTLLGLDYNPIVGVSALTGLVNLEGLLLEGVRLYDLEPLVLNAGLGAGDLIYIRQNHLCLSPGSEDQIDVDTLVARGATVVSDPQLFCPDSAVAFRVFYMGDVEINKTLRAQAFESGSADVAEWVRVSEPVMPGDVVALDPTDARTYRLSRQPCSPLVAGVISTEPGVVLGRAEAFDQRALLALAGIVPVKVTDEGGPIRSGDLLVASSTPGYAMCWPSLAPCSCALIGKALEPMTDETGVILVLLTAN